MYERCTAHRKDLDGPRGRRTHELTEHLQQTLSTRKLWREYGIVDGILVSIISVIKVVIRHSILFIQQPFTASFPRADIHELLSPDLLHQVIKGVFKDHLVMWVEEYIREEYENKADAILAEIDRRFIFIAIL